MQKGVVTFEDLREGMMITGKIKNVVDFGAFVDLGIKETALVHISEMSDHFVKNPMDAVKVGDTLEFRIISLDMERRRISLSRKSGVAEPSIRSGTSGKTQKQQAANTSSPAKKKVLTASVSEKESYRKDDDGTMYNPFAEAFRKKK
jgi:uncharacterized protein